MKTINLPKIGTTGFTALANKISDELNGDINRDYIVAVLVSLYALGDNNGRPGLMPYSETDDKFNDEVSDRLTGRWTTDDMGRDVHG